MAGGYQRPYDFNQNSGKWVKRATEKDADYR